MGTKRGLQGLRKEQRGQIKGFQGLRQGQRWARTGVARVARVGEGSEGDKKSSYKS